MLALSTALLCLLASVNGEQLSKQALSQKKPGPYTVFKTEPRFVPSAIKITKVPEDRSLLAPGYVVLSPHIGANGFGPQILDNDGNLIWYGNLNVKDIKGHRPYAMDVSICDFQGSIGTHLSWSEGRPNNAIDHGLKAGGANRIFNDAYEPVTGDLRNFGKMVSPNPHEFNVLPGGETFLQSIYQPAKMDLRDYGGKKDGWVTNGCFQEIDLRDKTVIFHWCFLDHFEIWETYMYLHIKANKVNSSSHTSGTGLFGNKWDFMHLNALDKNEEGDYLVSGRHLSQILKIAGPKSRSGKKSGTVLWRLNGKHSDFELEPEAVFGRQHHARFVSTGANETLISLFDNAHDGITKPTRDMSAALLLRLNNDTMKAKVEAIYKSPMKKLSFAQGSMHIQKNGNVHVGWGTEPEWSEFSANGTLLSHGYAHVKSGALTNYRSFKFPWVGRPTTKPKLVPYSQTCNMFETSRFTSQEGEPTSPLYAYVSWNGATEVVNWRFFVSVKDKEGPWIPAGTYEKKGFETRAKLSGHYAINAATFVAWVSVEALDKDNQVLSNATSRTFVPNRDIKKGCGRDGCDEPFRFGYENKYNRSKSCSVVVDWIPLAIIFALVLMFLECWDGVYNNVMATVVYTKRDSREPGFYEPVSERRSRGGRHEKG